MINLGETTMDRSEIDAYLRADGRISVSVFDHDAIWLSEGRVVFRISTKNAFGMDQRKATSVHALAMPDRNPPIQATLDCHTVSN